MDSAFFRHLILILILWFVWTLFLVRTYSLFWQVAWFSKGVRVMLNACIIWPTDEYFTDTFWVNYYVISSKVCNFIKWLWYRWVYVRACFLFWQFSCNWCSTIFIFLSFFLVFWSFLVPSSWKSSGSLIFFRCVFCENMGCLTHWTSLFWYFCFFFHNYWLLWSIVAFLLWLSFCSS